MTDISISLRAVLCLAFPLLSFGAPRSVLAASPAVSSTKPFAQLLIYDGEWMIRATHPWSGAPAGTSDRLQSLCRLFTLYFACEQTVNGNPQTLIVYTVGPSPTHYNTRTITPNGLAGARGDLIIEGARWSYLDKPPSGLNGPWSRVVNVIIDENHIGFEEYESADEGATWTLTNSGTEERVNLRHLLKIPQANPVS